MNALTIQFLQWVAEQPRTYAQAMDAWRSTCPRLTIWEDALNDGLIEMHDACDAAPAGAPVVRLSQSGRAALQSTIE
jgi:hypothetical protein